MAYSRRFNNIWVNGRVAEWIDKEIEVYFEAKLEKNAKVFSDRNGIVKTIDEKGAVWIKSQLAKKEKEEASDDIYFFMPCEIAEFVAEMQDKSRKSVKYLKMSIVESAENSREDKIVRRQSLRLLKSKSGRYISEEIIFRNYALTVELNFYGLVTLKKRAI